jgi:hypothetical protein
MEQIVMSDGRVYEMLWDCQFCGTKKNLGLTHRFCPNCGAPQNPDSRYYPSDDEKIEVEDHVFVGADVTCPSCNELNSAKAEFCGQCGSPLTAGARAKTLQAQSVGAGERFDTSGSRDVVKEQFDAEMVRVGVQQAPTGSSGSSRKWMLIIGVVIALIAGVFVLLNWTSQTKVVVSGHEWQRTISIEEYQNFSVRSWRDSPPMGDNVSMTVGSCRQEQRSTRSVPDGQDCRTVRQDNGDGTFSQRQECTTRYRQEPVYDDKCTWTGQTWNFDRNAQASGNLSQTPAWPAINLNCAGQRRVGCERESGRDERYTVLYAATEDDKTYRCDFPQAAWQEVPLESIWSAEVRVVIQELVCDTLKRE